MGLLLTVTRYLLKREQFTTDLRELPVRIGPDDTFPAWQRCHTGVICM